MALVVAYDERLGIGKNGNLPWQIGDDLKAFAKLTSTVSDARLSNVVIMGRHTWDSIPSANLPLSGRLNFVLTRDYNLELPEAVTVCNSLESALRQLAEISFETCFVIGGASVYRQALELDLVEAIYATEVVGDFNCDLFFPSHQANFTVVSDSNLNHDGKYQYKFKVLKRKLDS